MFWKERSVFVTGATGLVGSWLTQELVHRGARVCVLVRDWDPQSELIRSRTIDRVSVVTGELEDYSTLHRAIVEHEAETVFHLGAQTIVGSALRNPLGTFESNIRGSYNLFEACRVQSQHVKRVVVASSDKAYGDVEVLPYDESMPPLGRHPYDVSKSCTDLLATSYHVTYGLPVVVARCGNIYGGGDLNWSRIVPGTIRSLIHGQRPVLRSDGTFLRDYVYVKDAVGAYLKMAEALDDDAVAGEAFNFGPSRPLTVMQIVDAIRELMDRKDIEPIVQNRAQAEIKDQYLNSEKAARVLGIVPQQSLECGLKETIAWYREALGVPR